MKTMRTFQLLVGGWCSQTFGSNIASKINIRCFRFIEEALELVQSLGCTKSQVLTVVDYVFDRPVGEPAQEVGGTMVTLAALCMPADIDMEGAAWAEYDRINRPEVRAKIQAKQANKPKAEDVLPASESLAGDSTQATTFGPLATVSEEEASKGGRWISAEDYYRNVKELDLALNGAGGAERPLLIDILAQAKQLQRELGYPVMDAARQAVRQRK